MNALTTGGLIILYFLLSQSVAAFIVSETTPDFASTTGCSVSDNVTTCRDVSEASFLETVLEVSTGGIDEAPDWFNGFWVGIHAFLLALAIILIVSFFIGLFFGGAG